jgi:hypothetical protein
VNQNIGLRLCSKYSTLAYCREVLACLETYKTEACSTLIPHPQGLRIFRSFSRSSLQSHQQLAMFSFMKIATFAALTFGALASALPSPVASPDLGALVARQADAPDVTTVLTNLNNDLQSPVGQLSEPYSSSCVNSSLTGWL